MRCDEDDVLPRDVGEKVGAEQQGKQNSFFHDPPNIEVSYGWYVQFSTTELVSAKYFDYKTIIFFVKTDIVLV